VTKPNPPNQDLPPFNLPNLIAFSPLSLRQ